MFRRPQEVPSEGPRDLGSDGPGFEFHHDLYCRGILVAVAETWTRRGSLAMVLRYGSFIPGIMACSCLFSNFVIFLLT